MRYFLLVLVAIVSLGGCDMDAPHEKDLKQSEPRETNRIPWTVGPNIGKPITLSPTGKVIIPGDFVEPEDAFALNCFGK